jgi:hypothetical protein
MKTFTASNYHNHIQRLKTDSKYRKEYETKQEIKRKEWWNNLKPFQYEYEVPQLPNPLSEFYINRLIQLGAIPITDLIHDEWYYGDYRNSSLGKWDSSKNVFHIIRFKWGKHIWDTANHFQNDDGFALFVPLRKATLDEIKNENIKRSA